MHLFIWRHAEAEDDNPEGDLGRKLNARGHAQAAQSADWVRAIAKARALAPAVVASPAVRTRETATAFSSSFRVEPAIAPDADPARYFDLMRDDADSLVIVGHQPTCGQVIARLLTGRDGHVSVRKSAVWWFQLRHQSRGDAPVVLRGMFSPD
ncbi:SixA phosphatase family protein [Derxia gummosa]|uniref:SixA phosphatase family protein n=1 Tax=Derxia gummosa DSM 723 TaxID=1121388 RepID=A0A8B6X752_9BURK|nr:histidine phosphatase family protein [Derxia gummosa]